MPAKRFRLRYVFWLDMNKPDEAELADTVASLKEQRSFASTIRDGIRLVCDLRAGRLDALFELFPWVRAEFNKKEYQLQDRLARLEQLLMQQNGGGPKPLAIPAVPGPLFLDDDDDDTSLEIKRDIRTNHGLNFLESALALQGIEYKE
ncbi:MAG: hypothetical protein K8L99_03640 [Anaerolineae bacterium]|nr:hypothetical protein [Anaerolineae bacterium]